MSLQKVSSSKKEMAADPIKKEWDGRLSYSSWSLLKQCKRKYLHDKVLKTAIDPDASDSTEAMDLGSAFHDVLEARVHDTRGMKANEIRPFVEKYEALDWQQHGPLICAMLKHYAIMHARSKMKVLHCEFEILTPEFRGFVDVILQDQEGKWWIGDMKTTASFNPAIIARLARDEQLNLYAYHLSTIAEALKLPPKSFAGVRYRAVTKSKAVRGKRSFGDHYEHLLKSVVAYDIPIPKQDLHSMLIYDSFRHAQKEADAMHAIFKAKGPLQIEPNFKACFDYWKPCEFWSQCHGKTFTKAGENPNIVSSI